MGLRINTNVQSLVAQHRLDTNYRNLQHTQERLSSGSHIVRAYDDAAGLAISENIRATVRSTARNIRNVMDAEFLLQTADSALNEISNIVIRMKELAVQSASDTNGDFERGLLNNEYQALKAELTRVAETTLFNGRPLLNGQGGAIEVQVGPNNGENTDRIRINADFHVTPETMGLEDLSIENTENAREALEPIGQALQRIAATRGEIGAGESRINTTLRSLAQYEENMQGAFSQIRDADLAKETAEYAKHSILTQAGVAVLTQANNAPQLALKLLG